MPTRTTSDAFAEYHGNLKLDKHELQEAIATHHEIRGSLADHGVIVGAILQGSLARATMLSPLHDIDMVVFLAPAHRHLHEQPNGPVKAMEIIETVLRNTYPDAVLKRSRHAIKIEFSGKAFTFDIVPAFTRDDSALLDIANIDTGVWDESDTRLVIEAVRGRNKDLGGVFVHHVRMVKNWGRQACETLPGFALECVAYTVLDEELAANEALALIYADGAIAVDSGCVFVPGSDENILDRLTRDEINALSCALHNAADQASEANRLTDDDDHEAAIEIWHDLHGDLFPAPKTQSPEAALVGMLSGGITSTGRVTESRSTETRWKPTRSWRPA